MNKKTKKEKRKKIEKKLDFSCYLNYAHVRILTGSNAAHHAVAVKGV